MGIVTKTGDDGTTLLPGGVRVRKDDARVEALGALDELSSALGFARSLMGPCAEARAILRVQRDIVPAGAAVAGVRGARFGRAATGRIEREIGVLEAGRRGPAGFLCSGDGPPWAAALDVARTAARRAERRVAALRPPSESPVGRVLVHLNRLSDLIFLLSLSADDAGARGGGAGRAGGRVRNRGGI